VGKGPIVGSRLGCSGESGAGFERNRGASVFLTKIAPEMRQCQTKSFLGNLVRFKTCNHDLRNSLKLYRPPLKSSTKGVICPFPFPRRSPSHGGKAPFIPRRWSCNANSMRGSP
jgi:hypothetical protein